MNVGKLLALVLGAMMLLALAIGQAQNAADWLIGLPLSLLLIGYGVRGLLPSPGQKK